VAGLQHLIFVSLSEIRSSLCPRGSRTGVFAMMAEETHQKPPCPRPEYTHTHTHGHVK
jgi:hypothetical protein